tara:strand:- start:548 stop:721 length:174 start_codon:yes stop_codon:yes gene_type:complete
LKPGDLVIILYEARKYYIAIEPIDLPGYPEQRWALLGPKGNIRYVVRAEIKVVNEGG